MEGPIVPVKHRDVPAGSVPVLPKGPIPATELPAAWLPHLVMLSTVWRNSPDVKMGFHPTVLIPAQKVSQTKEKPLAAVKKSAENKRWWQCNQRKLKCHCSLRSFSSKGWSLYLENQKQNEDNLFHCPKSFVSQHKTERSASIWKVSGRRDGLYLDVLLPSVHSRYHPTFSSQSLLLQHPCRQNTD